VVNCQSTRHLAALRVASHAATSTRNSSVSPMTRRAVLDALEFTYDQKFADRWEFVAFAEKEHPELDLLTRPKRPEKR
jgi:hypothetical protein